VDLATEECATSCIFKNLRPDFTNNFTVGNWKNGNNTDTTKDHLPALLRPTTTAIPITIDSKIEEVTEETTEEAEATKDTTIEDRRTEVALLPLQEAASTPTPLEEMQDTMQDLTTTKTEADLTLQTLLNRN
jgi:hypothetical protein